MPERDWAKQFWEKTYAATKDYYAVAGKAADLLNNHS